MITVEKVNDRKNDAVSKLTEILKEWTPELHKEETSVCFTKKYNRFLQNRDNLKKVVINSMNFEYMDKQLKPLEKELKTTIAKIKKDKEAIDNG